MAGDVKIDLAGIGGIMSGLGIAAKDIRAAITGKAILDPAAQAELELKLAELEGKAQETEASLALAQSEVNKAEAANSSLFVSGWRPYIGWIVGTSFGVYYIPRFILGMVFWSIACVSAGTLQPMPDLGVTDLLGLLGSMLGFGALRSWEKGKGVAAK